MALAAYAIVTLAEAKIQLNIGSSDTNDDTLLESLIDQASAYCEEYTRRKIVVQSVSDEIHDGDGTARLYVRYFPVTHLSTEESPSDAQKLAAVQYRISPDGDWTNIEDDVDHIFTDTSRPYIELYEQVFPIGRRNVRLNYKAGFTGKDLDPIKRVVLEMVHIDWMNHRGGMNRLGLDSQADNGGGMSISNSIRDMKPEWKSVLDRYRVRAV